MNSFLFDIKDLTFCYQTEEAFYKKYCLGCLVLFLRYVAPVTCINCML